MRSFHGKSVQRLACLLRVLVNLKFHRIHRARRPQHVDRRGNVGLRSGINAHGVREHVTTSGVGAGKGKRQQQRALALAQIIARCSEQGADSAGERIELAPKLNMGQTLSRG